MVLVLLDTLQEDAKHRRMVVTTTNKISQKLYRITLLLIVLANPCLVSHLLDTKYNKYILDILRI